MNANMINYLPIYYRRTILNLNKFRRKIISALDIQKISMGRINIHEVIENRK